MLYRPFYVIPAKAGIQLKILMILVFFIVFWIPWLDHGMTPNAFFDPRNNACSQ
ncbi:hypothetical protein [Rickettsia endosymbiont of Ixodes pacificus]|uniref:hypothetical protein n=1 Tax=Rickettsia endosymbiont of Ixodes pacificus TaxID=1133329 RepID=UPI0012E083DE|nr:hypothetical protein [Rickettsia endosymbiont of Ixodes pacificus]